MYSLCGPRQLSVSQCGPETPEGRTPLVRSGAPTYSGDGAANTGPEGQKAGGKVACAQLLTEKCIRITKGQRSTCSNCFGATMRLAFPLRILLTGFLLGVPSAKGQKDSCLHLSLGHTDGRRSLKIRTFLHEPMGQRCEEHPLALVNCWTSVLVKQAKLTGVATGREEMGL